MNLKLYIDRKYYEELSEEGKSLYEDAKRNPNVTFPTFLAEGATLADCVRAFIESVYLEVNPKYGIKEKTFVKSELYKLGKEDQVFNLLVTFGEEKEHELLIFRREKLTDVEFSFSLIGDQTMFQMEY